MELELALNSLFGLRKKLPQRVCQVLLILIGFFQPLANAQSVEIGPENSFSSIYEPSGIIHVGEGEFIVIEDEPEKPFHRLQFDQNGRLNELGEIEVPHGPAYLNDLEGIAYDGVYVYVMTSHSLNNDDREGRGRKKLVRYEYRDHRLVKPRVVSDFKSVMIDVLRAAFPNRSTKKIYDKLNIEGLSWSPVRKSLMIGLRKPGYDRKSFILEIRDPDLMFAQGRARGQALKLIQLEMGKSEIRALSWNAQRKRFNIVTKPRRSGVKKHELWEWDGCADGVPIKLSNAQSRLPKGTEGIVSFQAGGQMNTIIVVDNGDSNDELQAQYHLLSSTAPLDDDLCEG